jgi:hypothetical protein
MIAFLASRNADKIRKIHAESCLIRGKTCVPAVRVLPCIASRICLSTAIYCCISLFSVMSSLSSDHSAAEALNTRRRRIWRRQGSNNWLKSRNEASHDFQCTQYCALERRLRCGTQHAACRIIADVQETQGIWVLKNNPRNKSFMTWIRQDRDFLIRRQGLIRNNNTKTRVDRNLIHEMFHGLFEL